jgi:cephalosporin hydroxylase
MFDRCNFDSEKNQNIENANTDIEFQNISNAFLGISNLHNYAYRWEWFGLPIIQMPEDIVALQEIIFETRPNFVIQSGVSWGGSVVFAASLVSIISNGKVFGIDIKFPTDITEKIADLPIRDSVILVEGSSVDSKIFKAVSARIPQGSKTLIILDSLHTHDHVLKELNLWTQLTQPGDYVVVSSTRIEVMPAHPKRKRPWGIGNNPHTALSEFLESNPIFTSDNPYNKKSALTYHPGGYLLRK